MAKTRDVVSTAGRVSTPHATKKRAIRETGHSTSPKCALSSSGTPESAAPETIRRLKPSVAVSQVSGRTNRGGRRRAKALVATIEIVPAPAANENADQSLRVNQSSIVGAVGGPGQLSYVTQRGRAESARQFPTELLRDYRVYRQLQNALVRLGNQMKAIKKYDPTHGALIPLMAMYKGGRKDYKASEKQIIKAVRSLPQWERINIRGLAENSFGQLLGETGDLSNYANPAKLWKRMGLGIVRGHRQQQWSATRKGYTRSENVAISQEMGYSPRKRALMAVIGSNLIRAKNPHYSEIYRTRKALEMEKLPKDKSQKSHAQQAGHALYGETTIAGSVGGFGGTNHDPTTRPPRRCWDCRW